MIVVQPNPGERHVGTLSGVPDQRLMSLRGLGLRAGAQGSCQVTGLCFDSRKLKEGQLFAALPGSVEHGARFVGDSVRAGAGAILTDPTGFDVLSQETTENMPPVVVSDDPRSDLALAASAWYGPAPRMIAAVTGTNGKTSVVSMLRQIFESLGHDTVSIGTLGVEGVCAEPLAHTTPDPLTLHRVLATARSSGATRATLEASSHGLHQRRLDGLNPLVAGFTNLSRDHFDYHADLNAYFDAKAILFRKLLSPDGTAVICEFDKAGRAMAALARSCGRKVIAIGAGERSGLSITNQKKTAEGQKIRFTWQGRARVVSLGLVGKFQASNALTAAVMAIAAGEEADRVFDAVEALRSIRGRLELAARCDNGASVFVDYAHTPDALINALSSLRPHVLGRLHVIIGAGGDRDAGKRPFMGKAAASCADAVYVTDDNPRHEDPATIRSQIMRGCPDAIEIADRAEAIYRAILGLDAFDALLIAGKGHETSQIIGDSAYPFDDVEQASIAVNLAAERGV